MKSSESIELEVDLFSNLEQVKSSVKLNNPMRPTKNTQMFKSGWVLSCFTSFMLQEKSNFAKDCRKNEGFFKCCVQMHDLNIFETSRNKLIQAGLIKDEITSNCKPGPNNPCSTCSADAMCTKYKYDHNCHPTIRTHSFLKGYKKHQRVRLTKTEPSFSNHVHVQFIHSKSEKVCGSAFTVKKKLRKSA